MELIEAGLEQLRTRLQQFEGQYIAVTWRSDDGSLLEFAEANDLNPPYSCRQGICGTCMCRILEGEVAYQDTPVAEIARRFCADLHFYTQNRTSCSRSVMRISKCLPTLHANLHHL